MIYKTCENCDAYLNPEEKCDCQMEEVEDGEGASRIL